MTIEFCFLLTYEIFFFYIILDLKRVSDYSFWYITDVTNTYITSNSLKVVVTFFRPGKTGSTTSGRGILSMQGLSYGVVRVDSENSLTSLTLQDCGQVMPGGKCSFFMLYVFLFLMFCLSLLVILKHLYSMIC